MTMSTRIKTLVLLSIAFTFVACSAPAQSGPVAWHVVEFEDEVLRVEASVPDEYYPSLYEDDVLRLHSIMKPTQKPDGYDPSRPSSFVFSDSYEASGGKIRFPTRIPLVTIFPWEDDNPLYEYAIDDVRVCFTTKNPDLEWNASQFCRAVQ